MTDDVRWAAEMPEVYDRCLGPVLFEPFAAVLAERVAGPPAPSTVLELAAGTGIVTRAIREGTRVVATDLNPAMVRAGARRAGGARWAAADAGRLPFRDDAFDLAVCAFGVMFLPDRVAAYRETGRVLVDGGRLVVAVWDRAERSALTAAFLRALAAVLPTDPPDFLRRVPHGYADPARIRADLQDGGFVVDRLDPVTLPARAASARALVEGFCCGTPLRFALEQRGDLAALTDEITARLAADLGSGEVTGPMTALVVEAHLDRG